jgi:outer membrane lipoprotein carrier protein
MRFPLQILARAVFGVSILVGSYSPKGLGAPQDASSKNTVRVMEARYHPAKTLAATFLERYTENGRLTRVEAGTAYFLRPGKMRWEYESPEKNLFLVDGKMAWFYVPADHTVTRVPARQSSDWRTPLALLAGEMKVSRVCARVTSTNDERPETPGNAILSCVLRGEKSADDKLSSTVPSPADAPQKQTVFFEVAKESGDLIRVLVRDPGGVGIEFRFANWRLNPSIPESLFHFNPPPGVAIVNGELASAQDPVKP